MNFGRRRKNKMLPFDDETVAQLKKNHHLNGDLAILLMLVLPPTCVASNIQTMISDEIKSLERGGPLNIALSIGNATTGKMNFTQADVRLGLAKARRYLILSNGRPDGVQNLHWEIFNEDKYEKP